MQASPQPQLKKKNSEYDLLTSMPILNYNMTYNNTNNNKLTENGNNIMDSPSKNSFAGIYLHTNNPINTLNSQNSLRLSKKFSITNSPNNLSKMGSMYSSASKNNPVTQYISTSTLQSGVASYSIPKEKRFENLFRKASCNEIYSIPEYKQKGITMPQSKRKSSLLPEEITPSSQDYIFTTQFDDIVKHRRGISISTKHSIKVDKLFFFNFIFFFLKFV